MIPIGATHVYEFYETSIYYKKAIGIKVGKEILYYGVDSGDPFIGWWFWDEAKNLWKPENSVRSNKLRKLN